MPKPPKNPTPSNPNNIGDYLTKKGGELGLDRADQLTQVQTYLDKLYKGHCRALSINDGTLVITTAIASVASELRLRQVEIMRQFDFVSKLRIQIR